MHFRNTRQIRDRTGSRIRIEKTRHKGQAARRGDRRTVPCATRRSSQSSIGCVRNQWRNAIGLACASLFVARIYRLYVQAIQTRHDKFCGMHNRQFWPMTSRMHSRTVGTGVVACWHGTVAHEYECLPQLCWRFAGEMRKMPDCAGCGRCGRTRHPVNAWATSGMFTHMVTRRHPASVAAGDRARCHTTHCVPWNSAMAALPARHWVSARRVTFCGTQGMRGRKAIRKSPGHDE